MATKKTRIIMSGVTLLFIIVPIISWIIFLKTPVTTAEKGIQYTVQEGVTFPVVLKELKEQQIISCVPCYVALIVFRHDEHHLKAGEYLFPKGATPSQILQQMVTATGLVQHPFTIIAGWNFKQVREVLARDTNLQHTLQNITDQQIMQQLGMGNISPEGEFLPETYFFTKNTVDMSLLRRACKAMQDKLNAAWIARAANLPYTTPYQALIVASLIEKEAHFNQERTIIAGVIVNRLRKHMLLQIDPTVVYGMGVTYTDKITKNDLRKNTLYNTYIHKGLPPTPIAMPGLESLYAAVHPDQHDFLYFVARGDGYHQFSKTLMEHQKAIKAKIIPPLKRGSTPLGVGRI